MYVDLEPWIPLISNFYLIQVLGTNKGRIVKINWFDPNSSVEVIGLSNLKIKEILMERLGRHWKLYASTEAPNENNPA